MRLNCHAKPPRLDETSDSIRTRKSTPQTESVDIYRKSYPHFSVRSVIDREREHPWCPKPDWPAFLALRRRQGTGKPNNSGVVWFKFDSRRPSKMKPFRAAASLRTALQGTIFRKA